jgi:hypothetical protein
MMLALKYAQHFFFFDDKDCRQCNGASCAHPERLVRHAALAKKIAWTKYRNNSFPACSVNNEEFHATLLNVHYAIRRITLREDGLGTPKFRDFSRQFYSVEHGPRVQGGIHIWSL